MGKYASRTARNLPPTEIVPAVLAMLCRDLYDIPLLVTLTKLAGDHPALAPARLMARRIDVLEPKVRAGVVDAIREAADLAIQLDVGLRALPETIERAETPESE